MNDIINRLIIAAGQWQRSQENQYERQFARLLNDLAWELQTSQQDALEYFLEHLGDKKGVAV